MCAVRCCRSSRALSHSCDPCSPAITFVPPAGQPVLQSDIQAVLRWSSNALLEAVRDTLQRSQGHPAVSGWGGGAAATVCCGVAAIPCCSGRSRHMLSTPARSQCIPVAPTTGALCTHQLCTGPPAAEAARHVRRGEHGEQHLSAQRSSHGLGMACPAGAAAQVRGRGISVGGGVGWHTRPASWPSKQPCQPVCKLTSPANSH